VLTHRYPGPDRKWSPAVNDHRTTTSPPAARDGMRGTVNQVLAELGDIAAALESPEADLDRAARHLDRLARETAEAATIAREITGHPREDHKVPFIGRNALNAILGAVVEALEIPPPAGEADELPFLRARSLRASEAARACRRVRDDEHATDLDLAWAGAWLDDIVGQTPASGYQHAAMSS